MPFGSVAASSKTVISCSLHSLIHYLSLLHILPPGQKGHDEKKKLKPKNEQEEIPEAFPTESPVPMCNGSDISVAKPEFMSSGRSR